MVATDSVYTLAQVEMVRDRAREGSFGVNAGMIYVLARMLAERMRAEAGSAGEAP